MPQSMSMLCIISTAQLCGCPAVHVASQVSLLLLYLCLLLCMQRLQNATVSQADAVACARHALGTFTSDIADLTGTHAATQGFMYGTLGEDMC